MARTNQGRPTGAGREVMLVRLNVNGVDSRTSAYKLNGQIFLRTPLTLLSPGWSHSSSSGDCCEDHRSHRQLSQPQSKLNSGHLFDRHP